MLASTIALLPLVFWPTARDANLAKPLLLLVGLSITAILLTIRAARGERLHLNFNLLDLAVGLYIIITCASLIYSDYRSATMQAVRVNLTYGILYFISRVILSSKKSRSQVIGVLIFGCIAVSLVGIYERFGDLAWGNPSAISSTFFNRTYLAAYLLTILPLALWSAVYRKIWGIAALATTIPALVFTSARIAWLGLAPMLAVAMIASWPIVSRKNKRLIIEVLALVVLIGCGTHFSNSKYSPVKLAMKAFSIQSNAPNTERLALMKTALRMGMARPALGWGSGTFNVYAPEYTPHECYINVLKNSSVLGTVVIMHAHNEFLEVFSELGLVGLVSFLFVPVAAGLTLRKLLRNKDMLITDKALGAALFVGITGFLVANMVGLSARVPGEAGFMYILLALLASTGKNDVPSVKQRHPIQAAALATVLLCVAVIGWSTVAELRASIYIARGEELLADFGNTYAAAEATGEFKIACKLTPYDPGAWYELGNAYAASGQPEQALDAYEKTGDLSPSYGRLHFNKATSMFNTGRYYDALYEMTIAHDQDGLPDSGERLNYLKKLLHKK